LERLDRDPWGVSYDFSLGQGGDALDACPESLAHVPALSAVARSLGLVLVHDQNLGSFVAEAVASAAQRPVLQRMGVLPHHHGQRFVSQAEWDVTCLYRVLVWEAMPIEPE
jgi:hypothetical protein